MGAIQRAALELFARSGGELVTFSDSELDPVLVRRGDGDRLERFWREHGDAQGGLIVDEVAAPPTAVIEASDPAVRVIRSMDDGGQVLHVLNHRYDEATDSVEPIADVTVRVPWRHAGATCTLLAPGVEEPLGARVGDGTLTVEIPTLHEYALLTAEPRAVG